MSNEHPIPKALRDRFDQIEEAICRNRMERDAVFTQMRTAVQAHFMSADTEEGDHDGRQLEWERCENKRLREALSAARNDLLAVSHLVPGDYIPKSVASAETAIASAEPKWWESVEHTGGFHEGGYVGPFPTCPPGEVGAVLELNALYPSGVSSDVYSAEPAQSRDLDEHDRSAQDYWADQAAQGKPYEAQLREACERNGIDHGLDDASAEPANKESAQ